MILFEGWSILNLITSIVLITLLILFVRRGIKLKMGRMYMSILVCSLFLVIADSVSRIGDAHTGILVVLAYISNLLLYLLDPLLILFAVEYVDCWMDEKSKNKRLAFIRGFKVFTIINAVVVLFDQILALRWLFYFKSGIYHRGTFFMVRAVLLLVFILFIAVYAVIFRKSILSDYRKTLFVLPFFAMAGTIVQILLPSFAATYAGVTIACLIVFISFQYNDVNVDFVSGVLNRRGLEVRLDDMMEACVLHEKSFSSILLIIDNLKSVIDPQQKAGEKTISTFADMVVEIYGDDYVIGRFADEGLCVISNNLPDSEIEKKNRIVKICVEKTKKTHGWDESVGLRSCVHTFDPKTGQAPEEYKSQLKELMNI